MPQAGCQPATPTPTRFQPLHARSGLERERRDHGAISPRSPSTSASASAHRSRSTLAGQAEVSDAPHAMADSCETTVLLCQSCSAPVALREGDTAHCTHCDATVPIPEAHQRLRAVRRRDAQARAEAEKLGRTLVPAGRALRCLAWLVDHGGFVYAASLVSILTASPLIALWAAVGGGRYLLGVDPLDVFGATGAFLLSFGSVIALIGVVSIAASLGRRRAASRLALTQALAAQRAQGSTAFACRRCGAPLELESSDLVERCVYCDADNLRLPDLPTLRRKLTQSRAFRATVEDAAREEALERADVRRVLRRRIRWTVIPILPFAALGVLMDVELLRDPNTKPHWLKAAFAHPRQLMRGWCYGTREGKPGMDNCEHSTWSAPPDAALPATIRIPSVGMGTVRYASVDLPLRKGEQLRIRWQPDSLHASASMTARLDEQEVSMGPGGSGALRVPWHGWHTLTFKGPGDAAGQIEIGLE